MQNAKANPGSVLLNLSSFVSFQTFYIKISFFEYCLAQFETLLDNRQGLNLRPQSRKMLLAQVEPDIRNVRKHSLSIRPS